MSSFYVFVASQVMLRREFPDDDEDMPRGERKFKATRWLLMAPTQLGMLLSLREAVRKALMFLPVHDKDPLRSFQYFQAPLLHSCLLSFESFAVARSILNMWERDLRSSFGQGSNALTNDPCLTLSDL